ncbi:DUF1540 domain-containing protein [Paludicola sp. MB14-C6]|uniref:DUF1540 domain-containing protein n=1 Tax=Paludihabitans sp. MB14-C6 TaxID=3070656 RepID=UPI0027DC2162|nr:DUF1540 domain-containing protein [Paludicola sp. MB14-C6]WMJ22561.1 DUF1540 domain-containing protein [Paludicola sp. MB14-C6]
MTNCQCNVDSCASNQNGCCCRPSIYVSGAGAQNSTATCCGSYVPKSNEFSNSVQYSSPNQSLNIGCNATNCTHNRSHKCSANSVCISCGSSGSECATFCSR